MIKTMVKIRVLAKSIRKHIRREKARIRRQVADLSEQQRQITALYSRFTGNTSR
ncbi:hypothetical protein KKE28_04965 [Patescibacteria group bacterium]|nr:hypothetical protein [Patescibacteria group bacterium]MBU1916165.1 hypothetical protein [Patescibacteria group bacterium]